MSFVTQEALHLVLKKSNCYLQISCEFGPVLILSPLRWHC